MDTQKPDLRRAMGKEIDARLYLLAITVAVVGFTLSSIIRWLEAG